MGNIVSWAKEVGNAIFGNGITNRFPQGVNFFVENGKVIWERVATAQDYKALLSKCSPLAAIISQKATAFANGKIVLENYSTHTPLRGGNKEWDKLLKRPNFMQTKTQFLTTLYTYISVRGFCYALPIKPVGFDVPESLWLLPPWYVNVVPINNPFFSFASGEVKRKVIFAWNGSTTEFDEDELILFTDPGAPLINEYTWLPESRILSLQYPITNIINGIESRGTLIKKRGAIGILSNETKDSISHIPMKPEDKEALQKDFAKYGLLQDQWHVIITDANLKWQQMSMNVKELQLFEEHVADIRDICDMYNYPVELLSMDDKRTYDNKRTARKALYNDVLIPEGTVISEQLAIGLNLIDKNIDLCLDYADVDVLQESLRDEGTGRYALNQALELEWEAGLITLDDWAEEAGNERKGVEPFNLYKPQYDKYLRDNGLTVIPPGKNGNTDPNTPPNTNGNGNS